MRLQMIPCPCMRFCPFAFCLAGFVSVSCRDAGHEPSNVDAGERSGPKPESSSASGEHALLPTSDAHASASASATVDNVGAMPDAGSKRKPDPVGGSWVTCYGNYRPSSTPERDVTRLGILCGPANGMKLVGATLSAEASENLAEHPFDARPGECFRVFAVAGTSLPDLAV